MKHTTQEKMINSVNRALTNYFPNPIKRVEINRFDNSIYTVVYTDKSNDNYISMSYFDEDTLNSVYTCINEEFESYQVAKR